jgi:hypothetical protein
MKVCQVWWSERVMVSKGVFYGHEMQKSILCNGEDIEFCPDLD